MFIVIVIARVSANHFISNCFAGFEELGYHQAFAGITLPNDASVALHETLGFQPIGVFREVGFKHDRWHDVGWWQRSLKL